MAQAGAPQEVIDATLKRERDKDGVFEVEPENWDALMVFLGCQTQWRREFAGMSGELIFQGLDYTGVTVVIRMMGHRGQQARYIFTDLQILEAAALTELNKRR